MNVRDAVETDAKVLSGMSNAPSTVLQNAIHDQTVRVAEHDGNPDAEELVAGFVSFDAKRDAVYVTHLDGKRETLDRLLDEPIRFARSVGLPVRMLVPESETEIRDAVELFGFEPVGDGPRFDGATTRQYEFEP